MWTPARVKLCASIILHSEAQASHSTSEQEESHVQLERDLNQSYLTFLSQCPYISFLWITSTDVFLWSQRSSWEHLLISDDHKKLTDCRSKISDKQREFFICDNLEVIREHAGLAGLTVMTPAKLSLLIYLHRFVQFPALSLSLVMANPQRFLGNSLLQWNNMAAASSSVPWHVELMFRTRQAGATLLHISAGQQHNLTLQVRQHVVSPLLTAHWHTSTSKG